MLDNAKATDLFAAHRQQLEDRGFLFFPDIVADFDHLVYLRRFGTVRPQYDGAEVWEIRPKAEFDGVYHSMNTEPLFPHTEYYEREGPPHRYQALWCVVPAEPGHGQTLLADGYAFLDSLSESERQHLLTHDYQFGSSAGILMSGLGSTAVHPVLEILPNGRRLCRFSYNCCEYQHDDVAKSLAERMLQFFATNQVAIDYKPRSLLLWDNFRILHARNAFQDRRRILKRVFLD